MSDDHWKLLILQGAGLVLFGVSAAILANATPLAPSALMGWLLLMSGLFRLASGFGSEIASGYWSSMLLSAVVVLYGAALAFYPRVTTFELTATLAVYLVAHALASSALAISLRYETRRWTAILAGAILDLVLAALILAQQPNTYPWVFCLILGLNLTVAGSALMFVAFGVRKEFYGKMPEDYP
jgi:uncharacterized membrane protein HdeD (DUF308 family)